MVIESFVAVTVIDLPYPKNSLCKTITATHPIKKWICSGKLYYILQ